MSFFALRSPFFSNKIIQVSNDLSVNVSDTITTTENVSVAIQISTDLNVNVSDVVRVASRKNYIVNPSFETNTLFWSVTGGGAKAQDATEFNFGSNSLKVTGSAVGDGAYATVADGVTPVNGASYTLSLYLKGTGTIRLWAYDGVADQYGSNITLTTTWTRYTFTFTAQATTGLLVGARFNATGSQTAYFDGVQLEDGVNTTTYFDGSVTGASWDGTAHNSTSTWNSDAVNIALAHQVHTSDSITVSESTSQFIVPPWRVVVQDPIGKTVIHVGSYSIDGHSWTQQQISAAVNAIVNNIPNTNYIAIGLYLDYTAQLTLWASAIHATGRRMWLRSAGFNDWQGSNSVTQYASADFAAHSTSQYVSFINSNFSIFQSGDVFETVPDEPEANSMWNSTYGTIGSGTGLTAYNSFITDSISQVNTALTTNGVTGIITGYVHTNPSVSKDVITSATAANLVAMAVDSYPESVSDTTGVLAAAAIQSEFNTWIKGQQNNKAYHMTFGPNTHVQMSEAEQGDAFDRDFLVFKNNGQTPIDGLTVWQEGASDNSPLSRLFDITNGAWTARASTTNVNTMFGQMLGIFVQENTQVVLLPQVNKSDSITVSENKLLDIPINLTVSDLITTTDTPNIALVDQINASDTVTLTENKQIELNSFISPSDTITVTENIKIELNSFVNKSDTVTLTENIVVIIPLQINVSDTITTSENLHIELNSFINTSDTITLTENVKAELNSFVAVSELITITDTPNIALVHQINVNDSITTTENTNIALVHTLQVSDSITITENIKQLLESNIIVSDTITIAESVMDGESMNILITESVSVSENVALDIPLLIAVSDTVHTRESYTNSFWFDGITGKIAGVAATPDATSATPVTISFWFRSEREAYVGTNNNTPNSQQVINYRFTRFYFRTANNQIRIRTDAAAATEASAPINFTGDATWHHVVGTYSPSSPNFTLKIYTDGVLRATTNAVTNFPTNNYGIANIVSNQYRGEVADVRIFHSLLTDAEAIEIYTSGANPATKSPVIWFWGDSPDGTTITDISGNGLNGTMSGGAALYQNTSPVAGNAQIQFTTANGGPRDRTTVIDSPSIGTPYFPITTSDNIAVSENIQIDIPITKSVSDLVTTSESIVIMLESQINTSDNITASEAVNVVTEVGLLISVSDRVTVTESPASFSADGATADRIATSGNTNLYGSSTLSFVFSLNTNQTTGGGTVFSWANSTTNRLQFVLGGSNNLLIVTDISLYGGAWPSFPSISANTTYRFGFTINGSVLTFYINGAKVGSGTYTGNYSWADILPINIGADGAGGEIWDGTIDEFVAWNIVKNDAFFVTDYNTGNVQRYTTDANTIGLYHFDNKLLDESGNGIDLTATTPIYGSSLIADKTVSVTLVTQINASDTITTNDIVQADIPNTITTSDTIALSEVVNETLVHTLATTETIGVSELTLISIIANQNISVQDTVNIDESVVILLPLIITASDAITVNEAVLENVAVEIFVSDNITIAENINLGISDPQISVTDSITVTETPNITIQITIIVSDTITASEALDILHNNTRNLTISNSITVTDTPNIAHVLQIQAISDTITLAENIAINPPHIPDPSAKLILVDGRLAYLLIDSRIPIYTFV